MNRPRALVDAFLHPVVPDERSATAAARARLPASLRTPEQVLGTSTAGCAATHGVQEACSFACTACYLPTSAQAAPPLPFDDVARQLDAIRAHVGPWGHVQITSGEVTLLPVDALVLVLARCDEVELSPMLMTHGQVFLDDPAYLDALVHGGLRRVAIHVDATQRGRPGWRRGTRERDLDATRARLFGAVRDAARRAGRRVQLAHTVTVTPDTLDDVRDVVAFALRCPGLWLLSLQPVASVGRTEDAAARPVDRAALWRRVCEGAGHPLDPRAWTWGHPACTTVATLLVVTVAGRPRVLELVREGARVDRWFWRRLLHGGLAGWTPNARTRGEALARLLGRLARRPRLLLDAAFFAAWRAWTERATLAAAALALLRLRRVSVRPFTIVVHHFMAEDELDTDEGRERLAACSFHVATDDGMLSMCAFNAGGARRALDDAAARAARPTSAARTTSRRTLPVAPLVLALLALLSACCSLHVPPVAADPAALAATGRFDDSDWAGVLARHVDDEGQVDYAALRADPEPLQRFVALLAEVGPKTRPELFPDDARRLAYWLNAYNALAMFEVARGAEPRVPGEQKIGFFYLTCFRLDGRETNLYDLENDVVRARFGDPRVHFALNCASRGCPRLPREPFDGARLDEQLERETARFLGEPRNVAVEDGALVLSEIFDWYADDFPPDPVAWIRARRTLGAFGDVRHRPYDWRLNARPGRE